MLGLWLERAILGGEMGDLPQGMVTWTSWPQIVTLQPEAEIWPSRMRTLTPGMATLLPGALALPPGLKRFPPGVVAVLLERETTNWPWIESTSRL